MDIPPPAAMIPFQDHVYSSPLHPTPPHSSVERVIKEGDLMLTVQASLTKGRWSLQLLTPDSDYFKGRERARIIRQLCLYSSPTTSPFRKPIQSQTAAPNPLWMMSGQKPCTGSKEVCHQQAELNLLESH